MHAAPNTFKNAASVRRNNGLVGCLYIAGNSYSVTISHLHVGRKGTRKMKKRTLSNAGSNCDYGLWIVVALALIKKLHFSVPTRLLLSALYTRGAKEKQRITRVEYIFQRTLAGLIRRNLVRLLLCELSSRRLLASGRL